MNPAARRPSLFAEIEGYITGADWHAGGMKPRTLLPLALLALVPLPARANGAPADAPVVTALTALEDRWTKAEQARDASTLREILDERFLMIGASRVRSREEFIAAVTRGPVDPALTQTLTDQVFLIDGNAAVLTEIDTVRSTENGQPSVARYRVTTTYLLRDNRWRALAEVMVRIPPPTPPAKA